MSAVPGGSEGRRGNGSAAMSVWRFVQQKQRARKALRHYEAQIAALQAEREELRAALGATRNRQRVGGVSDYEWHVELAAKALAQRDKYPMPPSVTTPEGFYEVMAGAALDATGLLDLLQRVARAERNLEAIQDALRQADIKVENARHRTMTDETAPSEPSIARTRTTSGRLMGGQVTHPEPRAVDSCHLASSVMRTKSWTGRWFSPHQRSPPRVGGVSDQLASVTGLSQFGGRRS